MTTTQLDLDNARCIGNVTNNQIMKPMENGLEKLSTKKKKSRKTRRAGE